MKKYYFIHFSFLILGSVIFFLVSKRVEHLYFFLFGFCWNFTFLTPGMIEKIKSRRYRFSLLRLTYVIHDGVGKLLKFLANRELVLIQDLVAPLAFYLPFALVFDSAIHFIPLLMGASFFEISHFLVKKIAKTNDLV